MFNTLEKRISPPPYNKSDAQLLHPEFLNFKVIADEKFIKWKMPK